MGCRSSKPCPDWEKALNFFRSPSLYLHVTCDQLSEIFPFFPGGAVVLLHVQDRGACSLSAPAVFPDHELRTSEAADQPCPGAGLLFPQSEKITPSESIGDCRNESPGLSSYSLEPASGRPYTDDGLARTVRRRVEPHSPECGGRATAAPHAGECGHRRAAGDRSSPLVRAEWNLTGRMRPRHRRPDCAEREGCRPPTPPSESGGEDAAIRISRAATPAPVGPSSL
jgi:hypothetical protein